MTDNNALLDRAQIALKCAGLGFPVAYIRSENGPRVRTHYYKQQAGTAAPLSKVINKSEDIALACGVDTCMITRERGEIAFAIPLEHPEIIRFDNAINWMMQDSATRKMALPLLLGQTTTGEWLTTDLAAEPHLLIAGSAGGGKSVFLSELLCALALLKSPAELDMYMVDFKRLDLTLFDTLPHVKGICTDINQLHATIDSLIQLVKTRTKIMQGIARNIAEYNGMVDAGNKMRYKLLVIDELAAVMDDDRTVLGSTTKERDGVDTIGNKLRNLTQISRAAGIHVIAATQRPSVKVISGDIKANFPMRLTFKLPTSTDSRVILGEGGAENLLGKGDYLYQSFANADTRRGHGSYVGTEDIARIIINHKEIRSTYEYASLG